MPKKKIVDIIVREMTVEDASESYVSWLNDESVMRYTDLANVCHSIEDVKKYIIEKKQSDQDMLMGVFVGEMHVGTVKLSSIKTRQGTAEVSYVIGDKRYWGKGIATEAISKAVAIGFDQFGLDKITAGTNVENDASTKVLEKNGFRIEGLKRKQAVIDGKRVDCYVLGLLKEEWAKKMYS